LIFGKTSYGAQRREEDQGSTFAELVERSQRLKSLVAWNHKNYEHPPSLPTNINSRAKTEKPKIYKNSNRLSDGQQITRQYRKR